MLPIKTLIFAAVDRTETFYSLSLTTEMLLRTLFVSINLDLHKDAHCAHLDTVSVKMKDGLQNFNTNTSFCYWDFNNRIHHTASNIGCSFKNTAVILSYYLNTD